MAIYHLSVKVISRANGSSALASAAYRSASRLHDERLDRDHDFTHKAGVIHSEVMLPDGAPAEWADRERLWNTVEAGEKRKDAQLAREVEFAIPRELNQAQGIELARTFFQREMVDRGMVADLNVHWDIGADGQAKPHAHVMLTLREVRGREVSGDDGETAAAGFGAKVREWNRTELVEQWRGAWADHVNARLAELDIDARIDHRSLEQQGIDLEPQNKIGPAAARRAGEALETERLEDHAEIARRNGARIIADPRVALDAITHGQATFTRRDLAIFVHRHSHEKEQFDQAMGAVLSSPDCLVLGADGRGDERFTSRDMIETEQRLQRATDLMAERERHRVEEHHREGALARAAARGLVLSGEQKAAFEHVTDARDLGVVVGYAGTGKSAMLGVAREAWEEAGYSVRGAALAGIAAENLEGGSGIASRTLASLEHAWSQGRDALTSRDVLVIDEAGLVGTRQMERVLSHAAKAEAKVVLVGDPEQLQAIEAGAAVRATQERYGGVEITEVRRQRETWQRDATRHLATARTVQALQAYDERGHVHAAETRDGARGDLVARWDRDRLAAPDATRIILTHTNDEVRELNQLARGQLRAAEQLGPDVQVKVARGERAFASGDRVLFLRNERSLGVKNGSLGTVEAVTPQRVSVRLDAGPYVAFDLKDYAELDHGYATTLHKSQGVTVDRTHVLATPGLDRHSAYVALSRHRDRIDLHYGRDDFENLNRLGRVLSRERAKDMALDHDGAKAFAERRGISFRDRVAEVVQKVRDIFADFAPRAPANVPEQTAPQREATSFDADREGLRRRAIQRHAGAVVAIFRMQDQDLAALPHQTSTLHKARQALNRFDPNAVSDLERSYSAEPAMASDVAGGRIQRAVRVLQLEAEMRSDPTRRADRFVDDWKRLNSRRVEACRAGDMARSNRFRGDMGAMAERLERDPQMESLLRHRRRDLGVDVGTGSRLVHDLAESIGFGRGRGLGI
jgi:Ti-type conjugative transfer relaxase TraA